METAIDSITPAPSISSAGDSDINKQQQIAESIAEDESKTLRDFDFAKKYLQALINEWIIEEQKTEANRLTRDVDFEIDQLRETGDIEDDECFIPDRVVNTNIQREMPSYINFLKNSRRIATFTDMLDDTFDADRLEQAFTKGMTYKGWAKPHFKIVDGAMTHGWASAEVVYDNRYPLHCCIEYIAHEDLIFPMDSKDIQTASCILRRYRLTPMQLRSWVASFGFDLIQVNSICEKHRESQDKDRTVDVWKRFCKYNGAVYVSWFSIIGNCTDWLKSPVKLYAGIDEKKQSLVTQQQVIPQYDSNGNQTGSISQPIQVPQMTWEASDLSNYPVFILPYKETEKPLIFDYLGRVFYDKDKQEAQTAIITAFVNRMNRSQKVFASPAQDTTMDSRPAKQLANIQWKDGTVWDKPMQFWQMPTPDPTVLKALEYMDNSNSQDIGQTDFATLNREDSRKTAREITAAQQAQGLLDSVDLTLYSEFIRDIYSFAWLIVRSQALQNKIKFLLVKSPQAQQQQQQQQQQPQSVIDSMGSFQAEMSMYTNDMDTIQRYYDVRAAGDVDVIQKQEIIQSYQQDWPVLQQTPLAMTFLADYVKLKYPQDGALYSQILLAGNPKNQIIQALGTALMNVMKMPDVAKHITPQVLAQLNQLEAQAQQVLKTP